MSEFRVSVAMCTYNGARFLREQLESIATQARLPDELVVCDDGSADESTGIVRKFAKNAPFPVRLEINETNLGSAKNFERAIRLCQGDFISLADQDDVWKPQKLAVLERTLKDHPEAGYVFSDAELIDAFGRPTGEHHWETAGLGDLLLSRFGGSDQFPILLKRTIVTGAAMAFRASLNKILLPISPYSIHDYWISLIASGVGAWGVPIHEELIQYRQHGGQQIGARPKSLIEKARQARRWGASQYNRATQGYLDLRERLLLAAVDGRAYPSIYMALLEEKIEHCSRRAAAHSTGGTARVGKVVSEVLTGRYERFSDSWRSVVRDLCF
jgi:glycosyltransferase involved in cell wall biosynthesis